MSRALLAFTLSLCGAAFASAEEIRIVLWNGEELFDAAAVAARSADVTRFVTDTQPDVLLIDEVASLGAVEAVRDIVQAVRGGRYEAYCSDFVQNDTLMHGSFEVGVITRFPAAQVVEFDPTPDNKLYGKDGEPEETPLDSKSLIKLGLDRAGSERGFLWARLPGPKLTVAVSHLKSSSGANGQPDYENAMKREYIAAAMAMSVLEDKQLLPEYSSVVAGDLNVGATDAGKNGKDLDIDAFSASEDRYDETHALLGGGLVRGLEMKNLTAAVGETYDSTRFPNTGPIDNIYVSGPGEDRFTPATKTAKTFGSDHFSVWTEYMLP